MIQEVVVTATKRTERLLDVPLSVSAMSGGDIEARGFSQFADYLNTLPGVYFQNSGPGSSDIRIRGIVATGGTGSEVATYFGETVTSVITNQGGKPNLRLVDIERVEVLRGPQGTLFGANALTGVLRIVPAAPDLRDFEVDLGMSGAFTAQSDDASHHLESTINIPLVTDRLALRLVGYKDDVAGYIDNVSPARESIDYSADFELPERTLIRPATPAFTRKDIDSEDTWGARAALRWQPTDQLRFDVTFATQDVRTGAQPQVEPVAGRYAQQRALDLFEPGRYTESLDVATLVIDYEWDRVSLVSASSFTKMTASGRSDLGPFSVSTGLPEQLWALRDTTEGELFTQEVRLQSHGDAPLQWLFGAFYMDQQSDFDQLALDFSCPTCLPKVMFDQDFLLRLVPGENRRYFEQRQRSVFGEVSYRFAPGWTAGIGARYLEDELSSLNPAAEGFLLGGLAPADPRVTGTSYELNPSAYLRYEPSDDLTMYVQAARGFRSGTVNQSVAYLGDCAGEAATIGLGPLSEPDTLWSYELGIKSRLAEGRLGVNAAVFKQEWKGVQLGSSFECGFDGTFNAGDVDGEGMEVELTARLAAAWELNLGASYVHNEFVNLKPGVEFEVGERVSGAPERNLSAGVQYDFDLTSQWAGFARADYVYVGNVRYKFDVSRVLNQPGYDAANVRIGARRDNLSVELFGRNITNEYAVVTSSDPLFGGMRTLLRPREIGVELRYSFH